MVATIRKLGVSKFKTSNSMLDDVAKIVDYYLDLASTGYYLKGGEPPGQWFGSGAQHFGLTGIVQREQLVNLMLGKTPDGKKQAVQIQRRKVTAVTNDGKSTKANQGFVRDNAAHQVELLRQETHNGQSGIHTARTSNQTAAVPKPIKQRDEHVAAFDVTFSAPKSVSVLWALSGPEVRSKIELAMNNAVRATLLTAEEQLPLLRRGKGGGTWEKGKIIAALFEHCTARNEGDPNLHIHALIQNIVVANDGQTFKLNSTVLFEWYRTLGPLFRNNLACELFELIAIKPCITEKSPGVKNGWFEIEGVAKELIELFSSRRFEILDATELAGTHQSDVKARQAANLRTRHGKSEQLPREELFEKWRNQALSIGVNPDSLLSVLGKKVKIDDKERFREAFSTAVDKLTSSESTFTRKDLIREVSEQLQDVLIRGEGVIQAVDHSIARSQELQTVAARGGMTYYTTKEMWRLEEQNQEMIKDLASTPRLAVSPTNIEKAIKLNPKLSEEQQQVVRDILTKDGALAVIGGVAGSGKSTAMKAVVDAYELEGKKVIAVCVSGAAAQNLQEKTGAECTTVERFLYHTEKSTAKGIKEGAQAVFKGYVDAASGFDTKRRDVNIPKIGRNAVVIFDEIGMADTRLANRVLKQVTAAGASIIAAGDAEQLPPIGPGNCLRSMVETVGQSVLKKNWRQTEIEAKASQLFRDNDIEGALQIYAEKGDLNVFSNRSKAAAAIIVDWTNDGHTKTPETAMIFVQTREEVRNLNRTCQEARLLAGDIKSKHIKVGTEKIHVGEWIKFNSNDRRRGIENSNTGVVTKITRSGEVHVTLDREFTKQERRRGMKKEIVIEAKQLKPRKTRNDQKQPKKLNNKNDPFIMPAYARTVHAGQGLSTNHAYFMPGGRMTNKNLCYVGLSRSTARCKVYIDQDHAGPFLSLIKEAMEKHIKKETAHEVRERIGLELSLRTSLK